MSDPAEGPEHKTAPLSPVSPTPLHYHSPADIPVLENQMDPVFNDTETHKTQAQQPISSITNGQSQTQESAPTITSEIASISNDAGVDGQTANGSVAMPVAGGYLQPTNVISDGYLAPPAISPMDLSNVTSNLLTQSAPDDGNDQDQHRSAPMPTSEISQYDPNEAVVDSVIPDGSMPIHASQADRPVEQSNTPHVANNVSNPAEGMNYQALLDSIAASASASTVPPADNLTATTTQTNGSKPSEALAQPDSQPPSALPKSPLISLPAGVTLPPRPPPQASLSNQAAPNASQLHDSSSVPQDAAASPAATSFAPLANAAPPPLLTAGAPGTSSANTSGLPPPPAPTFQQPTQAVTSIQQTTPAYQAPERRPSFDTGPKEDENIKWGRETQQAYDLFLEAERTYVMEGAWERFPAGSRLFLGNLSSERVTKRDLFHVFHKYGKLAQLSIKSNYGFAQFLVANDCFRALQHEQDISIRGRKIHLEISKPQRNSKNASDGRASRSRRSPSPDRGRGVRGGGIDRYDGGHARTSRAQDDWRPGRSRSPPGRGRRSPDRYEYRQRSRSPVPRPRRDDDDEAILPIPRRPPQQVPEVQIIVKGSPNRNFVEHVKRTLWGRGLKLDEMFLGERLNEAAVMRRQIIEGVVGVMRITPEEEYRHVFKLTIFDRSQGGGNVRFEEYTEINLEICAGLVQRAKQNNQQAVAGYNFPPSPAPNMMPPAQSYGAPNHLQSPAGYSASRPPSVANPLAGMDQASIQRLLEGMQVPQGSDQRPQPPPQFSQYGGYQQGQASLQQQPPQRPPPQQQQHSAYGGQFGGPVGGYAPAPPTPSQPMYQQQPPQQHQQQSPATGAPDISAIMAQLAKYPG